MLYLQLHALTDLKNDRGQKTTPTAGHSWKAELPVSPKPMQQWQEPPRPEDTDASATRSREQRCYLCREVGHIRCDCPRRMESPGRSSISGTHAVEAVVRELSVEQLEQILAKRRLAWEQALLTSMGGHGGDALLVTGPTARAVSHVLMLDVQIEGVPVVAVVDTGAQSTIISQPTLHAIGRHLLENGGKLPTLEKPTVRLYGKDGQKGGRELTVTAQLQLFSVDGKSANVLVFVQPDSEQSCLLGMNAISSLGMHVVCSTGEALLPASQDEPLVATVNLLSSIAIPSQSGCVVKAQLSQSNAGMSDLLFEPCHNLLAPLGVSAHESVLSRCGDHTVLVPMENHQGVTVHLEPGTQLGVVKPVQVERDMRLVDQLVLSDMRPLDPPQTSICTAHVKAVKATPECCRKLSAALNLPAVELARDESPMLEALVCEFADAFALDDSELGGTSLVTHMINTGDHMPIKQQPYRSPVVHRQALAKMIGEMRQPLLLCRLSSPKCYNRKGCVPPAPCG